MTKDRDALGELIRKWRQGQKLRIYDLGDMLGVSSAKASDFEWGYKRPDLGQLLLLSKWTGNSLEFLLMLAATPPVERPDYEQMRKDIEEGRRPGFISYAHDPEAQECRCNECRMARDWNNEEGIKR